MPTNQQNNKTGTHDRSRQNADQRDRKTMSDSDRGQQGKTGLGRDQDDNNQVRNDDTRRGGDRSQG